MSATTANWVTNFITMAVVTIKIVEALSELAEYENLRITVTESAKGALIVGSCAFLGGLVGGPIGLGVGGVIGAVTGAVRGRGKFKSVAHVLMHDMTPEQRERLALSLIRAFQNIGSNDILLMLSMVMTSDSVKAIALDVLKHFLVREGYSLLQLSS